MKHKKRMPVFLVILDKAEPTKSDEAPVWLVFLAYLAYLRAMRPQPTPEIGVLRMLIVIVGFVLVIAALVAVGAHDKVGEVVRNWPILP